MVEPASGLPCAWVLADALYGADSKVRHMLEDRRQAYVLAVRSNHTLRFLEEDGLIQTDPATLAEEIDVEDWSCVSAGEGAKGPRLYEWARLPMGFSKNDDFERWVLFRKSLRDPKALTYYFVHAPKGTSLADIAAPLIPGRRDPGMDGIAT